MLIDIETQSLANHTAKTILARTFPSSLDGMAHQKFLSISKCLHDGKQKKKKKRTTEKLPDKERNGTTHQIQTFSYATMTMMIEITRKKLNTTLK